jgi:hypothetical protein
VTGPLSQPVDVFVKEFARSCSTWWRTFPWAKSDRLPDDVALEALKLFGVIHDLSV